MPEGLPSEVAELAVVLRGMVTDFKDAMEDVRDELELTKRKAQGAANAINRALDMERARADLRQTENRVEELGDEITQTLAKAEALDGKTVRVDIETDRDRLQTAGLSVDRERDVFLSGDTDIGQRISSTGESVDEAGETMESMGEAADETTDAMKDNKRKSRDVSREWARLQDELFAIVRIFQAMPAQVKALIAAIAAAAVSFATVGAAALGLGAAATGLAALLGDQQIRRDLLQLRQRFVGLGVAFADAFEPLVRNVIIPAGQLFAEELRGAIGPLRRIARRQLPELARWLPSLVDTIVGFVNAMEAVTDFFQVTGLLAPRLLQAMREHVKISVSVGNFFQDLSHRLGFKGTEELPFVGMTTTELLKYMGVPRNLETLEPDQDIISAFKESVTDFLVTSGIAEPGETIDVPLMGEVTVPEDAGAQLTPRPGGERFSFTAKKPLQELRETMQMISEIRGAQIISFPQAMSQKLDSMRGTLEELRKIEARGGAEAVENAMQRFGLEGMNTIEDLEERIQELQFEVPIAKARREVERLRTGFKGLLDTTFGVEKRFVKMIGELRKLPDISSQSVERITEILTRLGLTDQQAASLAAKVKTMEQGFLDSEEGVRSLLQSFDELSSGQIDRIVNRLREMPIILEQVAEHVNQFGQDIADTLSSGLITAFRDIFDSAESRLEQLQSKMKELQLRQRLIQQIERLSDPDTGPLEGQIAFQRARILEQRLKQIRKEADGVTKAFKNMAREAGRAVQQLARKILRDLIQRALLTLIKLLPGAGQATSIAGGILGFFGSLGGGGGDGGPAGNFPTGGPGYASRTGGAAVAAQGGQAQIQGNNLVVPVEMLDRASQQGQSLNQRTGR